MLQSAVTAAVVVAGAGRENVGWRCAASAGTDIHCVWWWIPADYPFTIQYGIHDCTSEMVELQGHPSLLESLASGITETRGLCD